MNSWNHLKNILRIRALPNHFIINNKGINITMGGYFSTESTEKKFVNESIQRDCVVIFSKTTCSYCRMAKSVFEGIGTPYLAIELNQKDNAPQIQSVLQELTGGSTVPRVFINGRFVGGGTDVKNLYKEGKLLPLLAECSSKSQAKVSASGSKL